MAKIFHAHLRGEREAKYYNLIESDISKTAWSEISPQTPFHLLIPQDKTFLGEYEQCWRIIDIMPVNSTGVKTHRDHFVIDFDRSKLFDRIEKFRDLKVDDEEISRLYEIQDTRDWKLNSRRRSLASIERWKDAFTKCLYRPFDLREYYHHPEVVELPKDEVSKHLLLGENVALMWIRPLSPNYEFSVMAGNSIPHQCVIGNKTAGAGASYFAPLHIYPDKSDLQSSIQKEVYSNYSPKFICEIEAKLGYTPRSEAIFYYIYAIFHSPTYRSRYTEFLKIDFPRVPLTSNDTLFRQLAAYGEQLVALHLMKSAQLDQKNQLPQFVEQGGKSIIDPAHPKYEIKTRSVVINKKGDRFIDVPEAVWNFYVGGYPVCAKWLKDRKGRTLTPEDIAHYQRIVVALQETIRLMEEIDRAIPSFPIV